MKLSEFDYFLPPELIAQKPARPRDVARLLVLNKKTGQIEHEVFKNIGKYLKSGDLLVVNDSRVIPARLIGKKNSGAKVEILLSQPTNKENCWEIIGKNIPNKDEKIIFSKNFFATVIDKQIIKFNCSGKIFWQRLNRYGKIPLPPYIKSSGKSLDSKRYQTIYADKRDHGSVAAPTAGLHFTKRLLQELKNKKIKIVKVTLHVGLGTFLPIRTNDIKKHHMHPEWISVSREVLLKIKKAKLAKKKVIAVGTTSVRALESAAEHSLKNNFEGFTDIYIYPGFKFKLVDGLITNFHLPKSTLLLLVSALSSRKNILKAYQEAIKNKYRFYSYGDAMLILD